MSDQTPVELAAEHLRMAVLSAGAMSASQSTVMTEELALLIAERDQLAEKLAAATRAVAAVAVQRNELHAALRDVLTGPWERDRADAMRSPWRHVEMVQRWRALLVDSYPQDDPQPPQDAPAAPPATNATSEHPFEPQRPAGDAEPFGIRIGLDGPIVTGSSRPIERPSA